MHIVHCTTASNVLTTPAFLMFIQELWSYSMLADGSVASMSGWMLSQLYDEKKILLKFGAAQSKFEI